MREPGPFCPTKEEPSRIRATFGTSESYVATHLSDIRQRPYGRSGPSATPDLSGLKRNAHPYRRKRLAFAVARLCQGSKRAVMDAPAGEDSTMPISRAAAVFSLTIL